MQIVRLVSCIAGNPKGVVLSHNNILGTIIAMQQYVKQAKISYSDNESMLSYLTLAHIFGRCVEEFALSLGGAIGYWQVNSKTFYVLNSIHVMLFVHI